MKYTVMYFIMALCVFGLSCAKQPGYTDAPVSGNSVVIDINTLHKEIPKFFTYRHEGKNINFFLLRIDDRVLSFADACVTCYKKKRGYSFEDGHMVCRACNMRYNLSQLEEGFGGCYPIRLKGTLEKDSYRILLSDLKKLTVRF